MKIGIITFHSAHNYGAVLQAWSLQEYLKQQGHIVEVINLRLPVIDKLYRLTYRTKRQICSLQVVNEMVNALYYKVRCASYRLSDPAKSEKYRKFERFINKELPLTEEYTNSKALRQAHLKYDALIAGSDQIWNGNMMKGIDPAYFLEFANKDALRISYAASIGTDEIPAQYQLLFKRYLREFDVLSVREKKAKAQIEQLTDKSVDIVADPTFLMKKQDFDRLKKPPRVSERYIYVHNVHLQRVDEELKGVAEELSRRLGIPVIHNWKDKMYTNELKHFTGGVEEFLGYVSEAEYVVTNSFHCTVFALIYHRNFITIPHFKHPDRMRNLLGELQLLNHLVGNASKLPDNLEKLEIDYDAVEQRKGAMCSHAQEFLKNALQMDKVIDDRGYLIDKDVFKCCGCNACHDICPVNAILMVEDKEGFVYPKIDEEKCIHCEKCKKVCIYHQESSKNSKEKSLPLVYAAYSRDENVVAESTSGGMFTPMYQHILSKGGKVVGVKYNEDMKAVYDIAIDEAGCECFRGSKYVWADSEDVKPRVMKLLQEGEYILFSGTPCQIAGLKSYLGKEYDRLYTVELICHGVSSPKVFRKYCDFLEELYKSDIVNFTFRNKFKGVETPFVLVEFESGSIDLEKADVNNFNRAFLSNNIQRPSCYVCEYAGLKYGAADFTIGDYWGIEEQHPDFVNHSGVSVLKINTIKGKVMFESIKQEFILKESTYLAAYAANHIKPMIMTGARSRLMYYIDDKPIDDLLRTFNGKKKGGLKLD